MTTSHKRIVIAVVLVAAAIGGILLWRRTRVTRPTVPVASGRGSAAPISSRPLDRTAGDRNASVPAGEAPLLVDDDPVGALRLEGQVIDADQAPVGGVTVVLSANPPRTVVTQADGSFTFEQLVGRPYTLVARSAQGIAGPVTVRLSATTEPVIMHLRAASAATVTVRDSAGAPVPNANVELRDLDVQVATADNAGVAKFATVVPGRYDVVAWSTGYAKGFQAAAIAGADTAVTVTLRRGAAVSGRVVGEAGTPVAGANVVFYGASDWSTQGDERRDAVTSAADGTFHFDALAAGSVRLVARHPDYSPGTSAIVTLDGITPRDGVVVTVERGATVRGTVVDGVGAPVPGARVRIGVDTRSMLSDGPRQAYADAKGAFVIAGMPRRALQAVAMHDTGASATVAVDATVGDVSGVTLTLDVTGTIAGIVVDPAGEPIEGVQVSAGPSFGGRGRSGGMPDMSQWRLRGFPQELTDAGGRFTLTGLAPGTYRVRATRSQRGQRGMRGMQDGVEAEAGVRDLRLVLAPEGGITGKVAFADGKVPAAFTVGVGFGGAEPVAAPDGSFTLDGLTPGDVELNVRGPSFDSRVVPVTIVSGKAVDLGTITVNRGRVLAGTVVGGDGQPVVGATVYGGRQIFGNGSSSDAQFGGGPPMARGTKHTTTDGNGHFELAGYGSGDLTLVAEDPDLGRSKPLRVASAQPDQEALTLLIEPYGAISGTLRQAGKAVEGVIVSAQSTTSPGAFYSVASGPDGGYRFDKLAPDTYKLSAMVGTNPMAGMKFYSRDVTVPPGQELIVELTVTPGAVELEVTATASAGDIGIAIMYMSSGTIAATSARDLELRMAASGDGSSQMKVAIFGGVATFDELVPGGYTVCVVPLPAQVQGMPAMGYMERHGDTLPAVCKAVTIAASPTQQQVAVTVTLPAFIAEPPPGGGSATP